MKITGEVVDRIKKIQWLLANEWTEFDDYEYIGIRFEDKEYSVNDACANSKGNPDREDERDFPEYGTDAYDEMEELNGTCAWNIREFKAREEFVFADHAYIIAGDRIEHGEDNDEIIIKDAIVMEVLF